MPKLFVGIEIGGAKLQMVASLCPPKISNRLRILVNAAQGAPGILAEIQKGLPHLLGKRQPTALGVGFGGPINRRQGRIARSHQIQGWENFPLKTWFEEQWNAPASLDNDANVACLAEAAFGAGRGLNPVFYITLGSGVGGGLVSQNRIYHGDVPGETEVGHLRLNRNGLTLEQSCSGWAVNQKIRSAARKNPRGLLASLLQKQKGNPEALALVPALDAQDSAALEILHSTADDLAFGLSHIVHLQHPQTIILGGGLSLLGEPLRRAVAAALPQYLMEAMLPPPRLQLAQLGEDAVPVGALSLAKQASVTTTSLSYSY